MNQDTYFVNCQADGSTWSFVTKGKDELVKRLATDLEWSEVYTWNCLIESKSKVRDEQGHLTTMKYKLSLEQASVEVFVITEKIK